MSLASYVSVWPAHARLEYDFNLEIQNLHNKTDNSESTDNSKFTDNKTENSKYEIEIEIPKTISKFEI